MFVLLYKEALFNLNDLDSSLPSVVSSVLQEFEDCLSFIEFSYNRGVHSITNMSPFEIVYGFNPLTPLDLLPLPVTERKSLYGHRKVEIVKNLHETIS